ncbi:RNA polymerase sigma factor [Paenibacillus massiliensis]|uniref:RNA polymerase sigma factor n=1 Tax=Paenibacillus massiliensis TaxID=225917 RepID=UPI000417B99B|nr:RNA polymerase sigma factor [Paenibacillus massiliensis]
MTQKELFESYNKQVYRTCYYMVHNEADAEDLCQEVFISIFRSDWERVEHLRAWIMRIAVNRCLTHLKTRRRREAKDMLVQSQYRSTDQEGKALDLLVEEREAAEELATDMMQLPPKIRAAISLRYMHDFSIADIAEILSIPVGTAKSRVHKGLKLMKLIMSKRDYVIHRSNKGGCHEAYREPTEAAIKP